MSSLRQFLFRLRVLFRRERLDADMAEEMRAHLAARTQRNIAAGMAPAEARFAAQRSFGGVEQVKETARDQRGLGWLDEWGRDLRFAVRSLRRAPGFTATAIGSLTLGLALIATTLAVVNAYLIGSMPYPAADRLYRVIYAPPGQPEPARLAQVDWTPLGEGSLRDVIDLADASALSRRFLHLDDRIREAQALVAAPASIEALGIHAVLGRAFTPEEFVSGAEPVVMISHAIWRDQFGGDPRALGRTVRLSPANSGETPTVLRIIGVLPPGLRYAPTFARTLVDFALPAQTPQQVYMVRLRAGVPVAYAEQRINAHVRQFTTPPPGWTGARLESIPQSYVRDLRPRLLAISVAATLVLLIVAANVAILTLLRALRRQKEMAVRVALGAERRHLARMLGAESLLLCGAALVLGLALTTTTLRLLGPLIETRLGQPAPSGDVAWQLNPATALLASGVALGLALALSWFPLLPSGQRRLGESLRSGSQGGTDRPALRQARSSLLVLEVAVSLVLLVGCGLMLRTVANLVQADLGYQTGRILRARIQLPVRTYPDATTFMRFYAALADQLSTLSDTTHAFSNFVPFFQPARHPLEVDAAGDRPMAAAFTISDGYFATLGIELRQGRGFLATDLAGAEPVAIVSESLARQIAPDGNIVGRRIRGEPFRRIQDSIVGERESALWRTIVGVVADVRQTYADEDLRDVYVPFAQAPSRFGTLIVRTGLGSTRWPETIQAMVNAVDPSVFVGESPSLPLAVERELAGPRFLLSLLTGFAASAVVIALIGVYGVTAYTVRQRERDIAIRIAIGATPRSIVRLFLKGAGMILGTGILVGLLGALALSRLLASQLHGVEPFDPGTLVVGSLVLAALGLLATWWPARRAARIDPMPVLRAE